MSRRAHHDNRFCKACQSRIAFGIEVHIPASAVERRAHGFDELLCSLVVRTAKDIELPAADVVLDQLLNDGSNTAVIILGDFGLDVTKSLDGVRATGFELVGHSVYWLTSKSAISAILSANVEALALFRTSPEALERAALDDGRRAPDWRSLAKRTAVGGVELDPVDRPCRVLLAVGRLI